MSKPVKRRPYRSSVREDAARERRLAILAAAERLFIADGYPRTSIASIAAAAKVSADLVYVQFGNKRQLLSEVLNYSVTGSSDGPAVLDQAEPRAVRDEPDQRRQISLFAADIAERTARARPIDDVMLSAALVDDEVAEKHHAMHETRLTNLTRFVEWVAANGPLRAGTTVDTAAATVWAITGTPMHRLLVDNRGWSQSEFAAWINSTLQAVLLPEQDPRQPKAGPSCPR